MNWVGTSGDKVDLFARGAKVAAEFLCRLIVPSIAIRKGLAEAFQTSVYNGADQVGR